MKRVSSSDRKKLRGAYFCLRGQDTLWWSGIINTVSSADELYFVRFLDDPGPIKIPSRFDLYPTDPSAERFSWYLQYRKSSGIVCGANVMCVLFFLSRSGHIVVRLWE